MELWQFVCLLILTSIRLLQGQGCGTRRWQCDDGGCLPLEWRCDGYGDCLDGSDEMGCECLSGQFVCADSQGCVNASARCDGQKQCADGSDELNCTVGQPHVQNQDQECLGGDWACNNKICIPKELRCNGVNDCVDDSDEQDCGRCEATSLRCPGGQCYSTREWCDGKSQCTDASDEPSTCGRRCIVGNGGCSHECVDQPRGAVCTCPPGWKLSTNGSTCLDMDECSQAYGPCMHNCVNTVGSYYCHCRDGFQQQGSMGCLATGEDPKLLTMRRGFLGLMNLKTLQFEVMQSTVSDPVALAYDLARSDIYWADNQGNIYKTEAQDRSRILYSGQAGITSMACEWLSGQLYWTNQRTKSIVLGASDGSGFATLLTKNIDPLDLVVLPSESWMFWVNQGPGDRVTLERAGLDGSSRISFVVLTGQSPQSLTLDVAARRLYWISDFKKSVETVRVDGSGRYTINDFSRGVPVSGLAAFAGVFYWADKKGLWHTPHDQLEQKTFLQRASLPTLLVYHQLQQPTGRSACWRNPCQLCLPSQANRAGFTCTCPDDKLLLPDSTCDYPRFAYGTSSSIFLLEFKSTELVKTRLFSTDEDIQAFDIDWYRGWLYWANSTGHVKRFSLTLAQSEDVPTLKPVCTIRVDQKTGNLFWLSCDQVCLGFTPIFLRKPRQLYHAGSDVRDMFVDWLQGWLYWLEKGSVFTMKLSGGIAKEVMSIGSEVTDGIALDLRANGFLWNTKGAGLSSLSLTQLRTHLAGSRWTVPGSIMAALEPFMVSYSDNVITLWNRQDNRRVRDVPVGSGVIGVIVSVKEITKVAPAAAPCRSPSVMCPGSSLCISQTQLCDGQRDCSDGYDEENCVRNCPNKGDFRCKDRRWCVSRSLLCDGRSHCHDGSDELGCSTLAAPVSQGAALKCRLGSRLCLDGRECVQHSHVCDGERDCLDGSDELGCVAPAAPSAAPAARPVAPAAALAARPVAPAAPPCRSPSVMCPGSSLCISQTQLCDGQRDCPDGYDEESCVINCPNKGDFRCKDRRRCVSRSLLCDGRSHCHDGSDELGCSTLAAPVSQAAALKCRLGSRLCLDGRECVQHSHVCDGERDCLDGSDELGCVAPSVAPAAPSVAPAAPSVAAPCRSPSVMCLGSSLCISQTQLCDGQRDCPDGFDEENCVRNCPNKGDFRCKDRRRCVSRSLLCDGRSHCHDGSDELGCSTLAAPVSQGAALKCRLGSRLCLDGRECVQHSHVCDGERDCLDGSDELGCELSCKPGEFQCSHGSMCLPQKDVCDGRAQCQDRSDEMGCWKPSKSCSHRCDETRCIPLKFLCDGERDCLDGSDELDCAETTSPTPPPTRPPPPAAAVPCRSPSVMCPGSSLCISETLLCDGQRDCPDGYDEENCVKACKDPGDFLCKDRRKCVPGKEVCDGRAHCVDASDERNCPSLPSCELRCDQGALCLTRKQICDGRRDCVDGADERSCPSSRAASSLRADGPDPLKCRVGSKPCSDQSQCVLYTHVCDGEKDCEDGSDEMGCAIQCKEGEFQCSHGSRCLPQQEVCDGRAQCQDRSDEMGCWKSCSHRCDNKTRCIPDSFLCDGEKDCLDGTDEKICAAQQCGTAEFRCSSGQCVSAALRCDSHADCRDHSDEVGCAKPPHCPPELRCPGSHECLLKDWLCDGQEDCQDGSDERNCKLSALKCGYYQWSCASKQQCVPASWKCDGKIDCHDGTDELGCGPPRCASHLFQCGSGECLDPALVCNRVTNCPDGSDEGPGCVLQNCSSTGAPRCGQHCISTPQGPRCGCASGYRLLSSGLSCEDVDECGQQGAICSHTCLNTRGSYLCNCHPGYLLEPDRHTCKSPVEPVLLACVQSELLLLGLRSSSLRILTSSSRPVFSLDFHWGRQRAYWLSLEQESIRWASLDPLNSAQGTLLKGVKSDCLAVDWVGENLYWLDAEEGQILAAQLGTVPVRPKDCTVVLDEDIEQPRSLVLLPQRGLMFWSEIGSEPQIERSGMDGSEREVLVSQGLIWPVSLTVDHLAQRIYWTDEKLRCLGSASLEGQDVTFLQLSETPSPFSVSVFNDRVYWSDTKKRTIQAAHKNTGKNRQVLLKRPGQPFGLKVVHPLAQPNSSSPCDRLSCSHLCLLAPGGAPGSGPRAVCRCPAGLLLSRDGLNCSPPVDFTFLLLLSPTSLTQIFLRSMSGGLGLKQWPDHHVLPLPGVNEASCLDAAIQKRSLYVADAQGSVALMSLSKTGLGLSPGSPLLQLQEESVTALALDWVTLSLYWSSSSQPHLHVTTTVGRYTRTLLQVQMEETTSIALHPASGRLCLAALGRPDETNSSMAEIQCANMDGRDKAVLWRKAKMPTSLAFSNTGTHLYWADLEAGVISLVGLDGAGYRQYKAGPGLLVSFTRTENMLLWFTVDNEMTKLWFSDGIQPKQLWFEVQTNIVSLRAYSKTSQKGTNSCSVKNGGCSQLCLAYPGGRSCKCGRGYHPVNATACSPDAECPKGSQACWDGSSCLPNGKFCDGSFDCPDQSDEQECYYGNPSSKAKPKGGRPGGQAPYPASGAEDGPAEVGKDSLSCDLQRCGGHGTCMTEGGVTRCQCMPGYEGDSCEEASGSGGGSKAPLVLGLLTLLAGLAITALLLRRRARAAGRGGAPEKETLMTNMEGRVVYAESFTNDLYDPSDSDPDDKVLVSSTEVPSRHGEHLPLRRTSPSSSVSSIQ